MVESNPIVLKVWSFLSESILGSTLTTTPGYETLGELPTRALPSVYQTFRLTTVSSSELLQYIPT